MESNALICGKYSEQSVGHRNTTATCVLLVEGRTIVSNTNESDASRRWGEVPGRKEQGERGMGSVYVGGVKEGLRFEGGGGTRMSQKWGQRTHIPSSTAECDLVCRAELYHFLSSF